MILAGDIGGTKTAIGLFESSGGELRRFAEARFPSQDFDGLGGILDRFLSEFQELEIEAACFGVAGAVLNGEVTTTNLPWKVTETALAASLGTPRVKLINDLEAAAYGILSLPAESCTVLNHGTRPDSQGNIAVIAAGTGLGQAILYWDGKEHHAGASEGGHSGFAPRTDQEIELLRFLRAKHGSHVSYERVLSGPGLLDLYRFLRETGQAQEPSWLTERFLKGDPSATVTDVGLAGDDAVCTETLELFASIYGAEAGNLALKSLSVGGVFVGGGIAPKILPVLEKGGFMEAMTDKGRFSKLLESIEVTVSMEPKAPLIGAAHRARLLSS